MYFLGQIATTAPTIAALLADVIGMLTGTITTTAGLTAGNFQGTPKLVTTVAPGWSLFDAAAGAAVNGFTPKILSAPYSDDASKNKYVLFSTLNTGQASFRGYETWNATSHAGTNPHAAPVLSAQGSVGVNPANGWLLVSASANHLFISAWPISTFGTAPSYYFVTEYNRDDPWNTVANGYPSWISHGCYNPASNATGFMSHSRVLTSGTNINQGSATDAVSVTWGASASAGSNPARIVSYAFQTNTDVASSGLDAVATYNAGQSVNNADSSKNPGYQLSPLRLLGWNPGVLSSALLWGSISAKTPYIYAFRNAWTAGDEVDIASQRYLVVFLGVANAFLIKEV